MIIKSAALICTLLLLLLLQLSGTGLAATTVVEPAQWISPGQTHLALARALAQRNASQEQALAHYLQALTDPALSTLANVSEALEMAWRLNQPIAVEQVLAIAETLLDAADLALLKARLLTAGGEFGAARAAVMNLDDSYALAVAEIGLTWGRFYGAEAVYRRHLAAQPDDYAVILKLAEVLSSSGRHYEALTVLEQQPDADGAEAEQRQLLQATIYRRLHQYEHALQRLRDAMPPADTAGAASALRLLLSQAELLLLMRQHADAAAIFQQLLAGEAESAAAAHLGYGRCLMQLQPEAVAAWFAAAVEKWPDDPALRFYAWLTADAAFALATEADTAADFLTWSSLAMQENRPKPALALLQQALQQRPMHDALRFAQARLLAATGSLPAALSEYEQLLAEFPDSTALQLDYARALAWSRRYREADAAYQRLLAINAADLNICLELARMYAWQGRLTQASHWYQKLWAIPVDQLLADDDAHHCMTDAADAGATMPFARYEAIIAETAPPLPPTLRAWQFVYQQQKQAWLEWQQKQALAENRLVHAAAVADELLAQFGANQEVWFDRAQIACRLGCRQQAANAYQRLLTLEPMHSLAGYALEQAAQRERLQLWTRWQHWAERGRGDLADMRSHWFDLGLSLPLAGQADVDVFLRRRHDSGALQQTTWSALGLHVAWQINCQQSLRAGLQLGERDSGTPSRLLQWQLAGEHRFFSGAELALGLEQQQQFSNDFALRADLHRRSAWLRWTQPWQQRLGSVVTAEVSRYSDANTALWLQNRNTLQLQPYPELLELALILEHRHTRQRSQFIYNNAATLLEIIHPYWSPQDYFAAEIELHWRHDLGARQICGDARHYYGVRLAAGADNDGGASTRVELQWMRQWRNHWQVSVEARFLQARAWQAQALTLQVSKRF